MEEKWKNWESKFLNGCNQFLPNTHTPTPTHTHTHTHTYIYIQHVSTPLPVGSLTRATFILPNISLGFLSAQRSAIYEGILTSHSDVSAFVVSWKGRKIQLEWVSKRKEERKIEKRKRKRTKWKLLRFCLYFFPLFIHDELLVWWKNAMIQWMGWVSLY